jgi:hypothetical protein
LPNSGLFSACHIIIDLLQQLPPVPLPHTNSLKCLLTCQCMYA